MMFPRWAYLKKALKDLSEAFNGKGDQPKDGSKKVEPSPEQKPSSHVIAFRDPRTGEWIDMGGFKL